MSVCEKQGKNFEGFSRENKRFNHCLQACVNEWIRKCSNVVWGGFPGSSESKVSACNEENLGSIPGLGRSPGEGNGNPLQCSCLENFMDRGAW